jgi:hypothetical protein
VANTLVFIAGAALVAWGIAHLAPTKEVVHSFGLISIDNRRILAMEWIAEGIVHVAIGATVICVAALGDSGSTADLVYRCLAGLLLAIAVLTVSTGARTPVIWFKICPLVLSAAATLLLVGSSV